MVLKFQVMCYFWSKLKMEIHALYLLSIHDFVHKTEYDTYVLSDFGDL